MDGWDQLREERYARQIKSGLIDPNWKLTPRPKEIPAWDSLPQEDKVRYDDMMAIYAAMMDEIDRNLGKLMTALEERKQLDNTLILFLSDNGGNAEAGISGRYDGDKPGDPHSNVFIGRCWAHLNNTPFRKYKHYNHEGGTASPLIAHWPAALKPTANDTGWVTNPTHLIDIMATCVDLAEATYPVKRNGQDIHPMAGQSLKPLLTSSGSFADRPLYWEHEGNAAIRIADRKLVRAGNNGPWEFFDLKTDRTEQNDLAEKHPEEVQAMKTQWRQWAKSVNAIPKPAKKKKNGVKGKKNAKK